MTVEAHAVHKADWVLIYTFFISMLGGLVLILAFMNLPRDLVGLTIFSLMAAFAELGSVELFHTSRGSSVSVSAIVTTAAILALGPLAGVFIQLVSGVTNTITTNLQRKDEPRDGRSSWLRRSAFNTGMFVLSTAVAGELYILTGGQVGSLMHTANVIPLILAVTADTLTNVLMLLIVISLQTGQNPASIWKENFQWAMPILIVGSAVGGGALAGAYQIAGIPGTAIFFLPVLTIGYSFRLYANNRREFINQLEQKNEALNQANDFLKEANIELLETISAIIDAFDIYTFGHSRQVSVYSSALAKALALPDDEQVRILKAALIHDLGKVGIPEAIISKPGRLTDQEFALLRLHPVIGAEIMGRMKGLQELIPLVRSHQEKFDGSGYPDGLKGEEIPFGARIITLADSIDAMLTDRTYRDRLTLDQVVEEVKRCSGTHFDPRVVSAFLELAREKGPDFFHNSKQIVDETTLSIGGETGADGTRRFLKRSLLQLKKP